MKKINVFFVLIFSLFFSYCANKTKENKILFKEEEKVVPVKTLTLQPQNFEQYLTFYSKLIGKIENTKTSLVSDRVEKIFVRAGQYVKAGQVILQFPTDNPSLQFQQAKANYENLSKTYNRFKELLKSGEISQQNFDNIETQYLVAKRNYESLKQILFVEAPISGYISSIYVSEGQQVDFGKPLFTISVLDKVQAIAWVNEKEIQYIKIGMNGKIIWNQREYPCKIISVAMKMDDAMKGFKVEFEAPNPKLELKSGVTVEIKLKVYENNNAIVIPKVVVDKDPRGNTFVFVEENGFAKKRHIKLGRVSDLNIEVLDGLSKGNKLIIEGRHLLDENAKVKILN